MQSFKNRRILVTGSGRGMRRENLLAARSRDELDQTRSSDGCGRDHRSGRGQCKRIQGVPMFVKELWRYPVKSMAGERIAQAEVGALGLAGDRTILAHVGG